MCILRMKQRNNLKNKDSKKWNNNSEWQNVHQRLQQWRTWLEWWGDILEIVREWIKNIREIDRIIPHIRPITAQSPSIKHSLSIASHFSYMAFLHNNLSRLDFLFNIFCAHYNILFTIICYIIVKCI